MGARQVGKSTLCQQIARDRGWPLRTLDDRDVLLQATEDPAGLLEELGDEGAFIDEVQRAPEVMLAIKAVVDQDQRHGRYLVSGSNQPRIRGAVGDSLLGRAAYRTLRPLTISELRLSDEHPGWSFLFQDDEGAVLRELERRATESGALDWATATATGGFPRAVAAPVAHRMRVLDDYLRTFASRDIREVLGVESTERFESFLRLVATRTGQVLNVAGMATDLGLSVTTLRRWTDALSRSYLIELIPPYSRNAGHRVIKAPKLIFADSALALAASREEQPTGFHMETLIGSDLAVWRDAEPRRALYHWRLSGGQEVDFVLEENGRLLPVEIKASIHVTARDARHLIRFRDDHPNTVRGIVLGSDATIRAISPGVLVAPWWAVV